MSATKKKSGWLNIVIDYGPMLAFFLAYRDGVPVGRITAQIDRLHLERHQDATGHFGFIEAVDDEAVFVALLKAAEDWLGECLSQVGERSTIDLKSGFA